MKVLLQQFVGLGLLAGNGKWTKRAQDLACYQGFVAACELTVNRGKVGLRFPASKCTPKLSTFLSVAKSEQHLAECV
jgi:hypothetical protein